MALEKEFVKIKLNEIIPYDKNPRKNDGAVQDVAKSIEAVGYITPIVIDENNVVLCGHTRLKALLANNETEADGVLRVSGLTEKQKKQYRILDNKTSEKAEWDNALLLQELEELDGLFTGFEISEIFDDTLDEKDNDVLKQNEKGVTYKILLETQDKEKAYKVKEYIESINE